MVLYENEIDTHAPHLSPAMEDVEVGGSAVRILESCHSVWIFEPARRRFRRVPKGTRLDMPSPKADWAPYHRLEIEPSTGGFSVALNEDGTRVLRSWLHIEPCRHCAGDQTSELSLEAIRRSV